MLNFVKIAAIAAPLVAVSMPAAAGQWAVDLGRCPDHLEDIRDRFEDRFDRRIDLGRADRLEDRRDRRENRRDERVTVCPGSALVYQANLPGRARPWRRPERIRLVRDRGGFARVSRFGELVPVRTFAPRPEQLRRLRRAARRDARREIHAGPRVIVNRPDSWRY